jgi:hypothetical protein
MERLRLFGAAGGAAFAVVTLIAFVIAPGPSSASGETVLEYYAAHGTATLWQASLAGFSVVLFIWFAETFAGETSSRPVAVVGAAVTAALYLITIGCLEVIAETYGGIDTLTVTSADYRDAHVFYVVGQGAAHLAHFVSAAFVGSTAAAILTSTSRWRWLGWIGLGFTAVRLISAEIVLASESHWSDVLGSIVFIGFLAWVFVISVWLVLAMQGGWIALQAVDS